MDAGSGVAALGVAMSGVALAHGAAWSLLALAALRKPAPDSSLPPRLRFTVIVPAHNEAASIASTVRSLLADPLEPRPHILVVADNCSDNTAEIARNAGAEVLVRDDLERRGKSFALDHAIAHCEASGDPPDAYVVIDADTAIEPGFFAAMARALVSGADIAQARYDVAEPRTDLAELRALAFSLVHYARPLGAARLGLGMGLKGNGMAFRRAIVAGGIPGAGLAEDAAATLTFARAGIGVRFVPAAVVRGEMAGGYAAARGQDRRWEGGRLALIPRALATAAGALARGHWAAAGSAFDVAALPLSLVGLLAVGGMALALVGFGSLPFAAAALVAVAAYPPLGWLAAREPWSRLKALVSAPRFVAYKLSTLARLALSGAPKTWERTQREARE